MAKSYKKKERQSKQNNFNITARDVTRKCLLNRYFIHRKTIIKNREGKKRIERKFKHFQINKNGDILLPIYSHKEMSKRYTSSRKKIISSESSKMQKGVLRQKQNKTVNV